MRVRSILAAVLIVPVTAFSTTVTLHFLQGNIPRSVMVKAVEKHRGLLPPVPERKTEAY